MLGGAWLVISIVLVLLGLTLRNVPLLMVGLLFFLTSGVARLWAKYSLSRLTYSRSLNTQRAFFGEQVTLEIQAENRKLLPLPWVYIEDEVPDELDFRAGRVVASYKPTRFLLLNSLSLAWYHRVRRAYPIDCNHRGYFTFGPARVISSDMFGFFTQEKTVEGRQRLLIYPKVVPLHALGIPSREPFGNIRVRRHLLEDPSRVVATRDYAYGDPLRFIHWKTTARVAKLQTRQFEPTTSPDMAIFLDARTLEPPYWGRVEQLLETEVVVAASIANHAIQHGYRVGLYVNQSFRFTDRLIKVPPSGHPDQMLRILEALAHVFSPELIPMENLVIREGRNLPWGSSLVVITPVPTERLLTSILQFRRVGRSASMVHVGPRAPSAHSNGVPVYHVSSELPWRELESVSIAGIVGRR